MRWAIATSGYALTARPALELLGLPEDTPMVTRDLVRHAKPDPDLFLAAAALLGVEPQHAMVVGDSVWDLLAARRAGSLGIGLQSGGYGREELERAGAYRVYADPAEMLSRVDEIGVRLDDNVDDDPAAAARPVPQRVMVPLGLMGRRDEDLEQSTLYGIFFRQEKFPRSWLRRG